jgi:hypothetical protein
VAGVGIVFDGKVIAGIVIEKLVFIFIFYL